MINGSASIPQQCRLANMIDAVSIKQSQELAMASNLAYAHIPVDAGAAMKFYHIVWNDPVEFKNVIIHLGDYHAMMEFFCCDWEDDRR